MELEYTVTGADVLALARYRLDHVPALRRRIQSRRFLYFLGFALLALGTWSLLHRTSISGTFLALALLSLVLAPAWTRWLMLSSVSRTYRDDKPNAMLGQRTLRASEDGLEQRFAVGESTVKWEFVDNLVVTGHYLFISIAGAGYSIAVPRERVSSGDCDEFVGVCRDFMKGVVAA